jgi:hypothetical protein
VARSANAFDSVCATTIVRTTTLARSSKAGDPTCKRRHPFPLFIDSTHGFSGAPLPATVWSVVEANTGIICACLPMIKGLVFSIFPALSSSSRTEIDENSLTHKRQSHQSRSNNISNVDRTYQPWTMQTATHSSHIVSGKQEPLGRASHERILGRAPVNGAIMKMIELSVTDHCDHESL